MRDFFLPKKQWYSKSAGVKRGKRMTVNQKKWGICALRVRMMRAICQKYPKMIVNAYIVFWHHASYVQKKKT